MTKTESPRDRGWLEEWSPNNDCSAYGFLFSFVLNSIQGRKVARIAESEVGVWLAGLCVEVWGAHKT